MFYITHSNGSNTVAYLRARKIKLITKITDNKQSIGKRRRFCLCAVHVKIWTVGVRQQLFLSQYTPCRNFVESVEFSAISISGGALVGWHFESTECEEKEGRRIGGQQGKRGNTHDRENTGPVRYVFAELWVDLHIETVRSGRNGFARKQTK